MSTPKIENATPKKARNKPSISSTRRSNRPGDELGKHKTQTFIESFFVKNPSPLRFEVKSERQARTDAVGPKEVRKALFTNRLPACTSLVSADTIVITDDEEMDQSSLENYHLKTKSSSGGATKLRFSLSRKLHKIKSSTSSSPITSQPESVSTESPCNTGVGELKSPESSTSSSLTSDSPGKRFRKQRLSQTYISEISIASHPEVLNRVDGSGNVGKLAAERSCYEQSKTATLNTGVASQTVSRSPSKRCLMETHGISQEHRSGFDVLEPGVTVFKVRKIETSLTYGENPCSAIVNARSSVLVSHQATSDGSSREVISKIGKRLATAKTAGLDGTEWNSPMVEQVELNTPMKKTAVPVTPQKSSSVKNYPYTKLTSSSITPTKLTSSDSKAASSVSAAAKENSSPQNQQSLSHSKAISQSGQSAVQTSHKNAQVQGSTAISNTLQIRVKTESDWSPPMEKEIELTSPIKQTTIPKTPLKDTPMKNGPCTPTKYTNSSSVSGAAQLYSTPQKQSPKSPSKAAINRSGPSSPFKRSPYKRLKKGSPQKSPMKVDMGAMSGSLVLKHSIVECKRYAQMATKCNSTIKKVADDYMSLFDREKVLLHKLLVRKWAWIRMIDMKYDKIVDNLVSSVDLLCDKGFLEEISRNEPLDVVLGQLKRPELETLSRNYEDRKTGSSKKDDLVNRLCKFVSVQGSLGFTKKSLKTALTDTAFSLLGKCVRIREDTRTILQKIFEASMSPLYFEGQFYSFQQRLSGMERLMSEVKFEGKKLIPFPLSDFQLFLSPAQFDEFITSVILKFDMLSAKDEKDNARGVELAKDARATFMIFLSNPAVKEFLKKIPNYIWRYTAGSNYTSALDVGIDFLKRAKKYEDAILTINILLGQGEFRKHSRGRWYAEKVMIMDKQLKAPAEAIYPVLLAGLQDDLTPIGRLELSKKAEGIIKKKKGGLTVEQKREIRELMRIPQLRHGMKEIRSTEAPNMSTGTRQTFVEFSASGERTYLNVEQVARNSYMSEFPEGMHDEGLFIKNIILAAFWPVIYMPKENMFVSKYQNRPLDWGTQAFYRNRKQEIADHILHLRGGGIDGVMQQITDVVTVYANHHSLVSWSNISFDMLPTIKNVITCLTLDKFLKLAEYLLASYRERRSGWPDLTLWNTVAGKFKLVEVKSPNDELSYKQIIWLEKLAEMGIDVEECRVNASNKGKKRKAQTPDLPSDYSQEV